MKVRRNHLFFTLLHDHVECKNNGLKTFIFRWNNLSLGYQTNEHETRINDESPIRSFIHGPQ